MDRTEGKEGEVKLHAIWKNFQAMMCMYILLLALCAIDNISIRDCQIIVKVNHLCEVYG